MITAGCPNCQAQFQVSSDLVGKQGKCPTCQAVFTSDGSGQAAPQQFPDPPQGPTVQEQFPPPQESGDSTAVGLGTMQAHRGGLVLGLAVGGFFLFPLLIIAIVFGKADLKKMDQGLMDPPGRGMTQAGVVVGYVLVFTTIILTVVIFLYCAALMREITNLFGVWVLVGGPNGGFPSSIQAGPWF